MNSIIITAHREEKTIGKTLDSILQQGREEDEIICVCPDLETRKRIKEYEKKYKNVKCIQDPKEGKPTALNLAIQEASGDILILTDGDVFLGDNSLKEILKPFKDKKVGIVSGRPFSLNPRSNKWGYFSHLLTDVGAHETRLKQIKKNKMIVCSGYLYAFRKNLIKIIPEEIFSEDALISHLIHEMGYKTEYTPQAKVFVKYPDNFKDWIIQKRRSTGGYNQLKFYLKHKERMRSFSKEVYGIVRIFSYPRNFKEFLWTIELVFLRIYLWLLVFKDVTIQKKGLKEVWLRVESTK